MYEHERVSLGALAINMCSFMYACPCVYVFACMQVCPIVRMLVYVCMFHSSQSVYVYRICACVCMTSEYLSMTTCKTFAVKDFIRRKATWLRILVFPITPSGHISVHV